MAKGHTLGATLLLWCSVRYTLSSSGGGARSTTASRGPGHPPSGPPNKERFLIPDQGLHTSHSLPP